MRTCGNFINEFFFLYANNILKAEMMLTLLRSRVNSLTREEAAWSFRDTIYITKVLCVELICPTAKTTNKKEIITQNNKISTTE